MFLRAMETRPFYIDRSVYLTRGLLRPYPPTDSLFVGIVARNVRNGFLLRRVLDEIDGDVCFPDRNGTVSLAVAP